MLKTFAYRYLDIKQKPRDIKTLVDKYPFLQEPHHVSYLNDNVTDFYFFLIVNYRYGMAD